MSQQELFDTASRLPDGFVYQRDFISRGEEASLLEVIAGLPLEEAQYMPDFEAIVGVSLGGSCRMRLRPYRPGERNRREGVITLELEPRSAYSMRGAARWGWQHSIAATQELRYSITLRTARR